MKIPDPRPEPRDGKPPDISVTPITHSGDAEYSGHRTAIQLRKTVDDFLEHLRYIARQDWNEFRQEELVLAQNRHDWLTEELWKLVLENKHPQHCGCDICFKLRVAEDR
jgi:hypothetical protein